MKQAIGRASGGPDMPEAQPAPMLRMVGAGLGRRVLIGGAFLAAYVALERLSFIHEYQGLPITPWNPALGMMFALLVLIGAPAAGLLFAGVVIAETFVLESKLAWPIIFAIGAVVSASYAAAALVATRALRFDPALPHLRDVLILLGAGVGGSIVVAAALTALLVATGHLARDEIVSAAAPLMIGDVIGVAVMTPLVLRLAHRRRDVRIDRLSALALGLLIYATLIFVALRIIVAGDGGSKFFYLFFIPVIVAAIRHGLDGACLSLAATQFSLVALLDIYGYDARAFTEFQTLMFVLTATGLIIGVVISERENADQFVRVAEARLREKEAEAARAARMTLVSSMASTLAHEINQPMTAARALARSAQHILRSDDADLPRARTNIENMIAQIDHAGEVVRRMRDFLRRGQPQAREIEVRGMLEDALSLVRAESAAKQIAIDLNVADGLPPVHGDRVQLQQVALNLVANAMEAMTMARTAKPRIEVGARRAGAALVISVRDNGPGVSDNLAERLFEPLSTSKQEGLGLGLSICVSIVEAHGGRIWLESQAPGATEFRVSLPIEPS
jgi:two-component system sensor kinase FixL